MFKPFRYFLPSFIVLSIFRLFSPTISFAQEAWETGNNKGTNHICVTQGGVATIQGFECLFYNIIQVVVVFAGLAFFIMFIIGGFNYLFSSNDEKKVAAAASTLTMAIFGLIGIIASSFILRFINNFTGVNVVDFIIPYVKP